MISTYVLITRYRNITEPSILVYFISNLDIVHLMSNRIFIFDSLTRGVTFPCLLIKIHYLNVLKSAQTKLACVADETKPRYSPSANQRPKACSTPRMLPGFSIIGSNWLLHTAVLLCTVIGRVDLVAPWLRSR